MLVRDVERCLVNTNLTFGVFYGMYDLPVEGIGCGGINTLYGPYMELYKYLCEDFEGFDDMIKDWFESNFYIKGEEVFPMGLLDVYQGRVQLAQHFLTFVDRYREEIMHLNTLICLERVDDPGIQYTLMDMRGYFTDIVPSYDPRFDPPDCLIDVMVQKIDKWIFSVSDTEIDICWDVAYRMCVFIRDVILHQIDVLYNPDKYREMEELRKDFEEHGDERNQYIEWHTVPGGETMYRIRSKDEIKFNMPTKKEKTKETQKNVNNLDEDQGVDVKKPKKVVDDKESYKKQLSAYTGVITRLLAILNDNDPNKYAKDTKKHGVDVKKIKINKDFKDLSRYFDNKAYEVSDRRFKIRYLTYVGKWFVDNVDEFAKNVSELNEDDKFLKYESRLHYVEVAVARMSDLITNVLEGKPYDEELQYINNMQTFLNRKNKSIKKTSKKMISMSDQRAVLSSRARRFSGVSEDITLDTLMKLAYLAATNDTKCKNAVKFRDGIKLRDKKACQSLIEELGRSIMKSCKEKGATEMFKFFFKSSPEIYTRFKSDNTAISVGICAIQYYAMSAGDKNISRLVKRLF